MNTKPPSEPCHSAGNVTAINVRAAFGSNDNRVLNIWGFVTRPPCEQGSRPSSAIVICEKTNRHIKTAKLLGGVRPSSSMSAALIVSVSCRGNGSGKHLGAEASRRHRQDRARTEGQCLLTAVFAATNPHHCHNQKVPVVSF